MFEFPHPVRAAERNLSRAARPWSRSHRAWPRLVALLVVAAVALGATGSRAQDAPASDPPSFDLSGKQIRFTTAGETLEMPAFRMMDMLEEWGAEVEKVELTSTTGVQALLAGQAELAGQGSDELILGAAQGADLVAIATTRDKMDYVLVVNNEIGSVDDLRGKTIGMSGPAGFDTLLARMTVRQNGMELEDVQFVQIGGSPDRAAALLAGRIDAAVVFISDWFELQNRTQDIKDLLYMSELVPGAAKSVVFTKRDYLAENQDLALALACANLEAFEWFHEDKQRFVDYTLENVEGTTEEATAQLYDELVRLDMYPLDPSELLQVDGVQALADAMLENGDIENPVDAAQIVDRSYLEEAAGMGCGAQGIATPAA
ncbi:MAG: ABC transporter substrate-binding protein [Chloroflexota bacterium]|nr:ABC transporter substrate-binding protein [Chloroflexota bacterium]